MRRFGAGLKHIVRRTFTTKGRSPAAANRNASHTRPPDGGRVRPTH